MIVVDAAILAYCWIPGTKTPLLVWAAVVCCSVLGKQAS